MRRFLLAAVFLSVLTAGCGSTANVDAIKKFGSLAGDAQTTSDTMAASLYQDCLTAREYGGFATLGSAPGTVGAALSSEPLVGAVPPPPVPAELSNPGTAPAAGAPQMARPAGTGTPKPAPAHTPPPNDTTCSYDQQTSQRWQSFNDGIFAYVKGLGAVAGVAVAPSASKYKTAAEGLVNVGLVRNDALADAAGKFVADIGNEVLKHQQDRDLRDLIARSQQDGIFQQMIDAAQFADQGYYGAVGDDKVVVDEYFQTFITAESLELVQLLKADGDVPAGAPASDALQINAAARDALERRCASACERHVQLVARVVEIRDRIAAQRERWSTLDEQMLTDLSRAQPFYATMTDLGRANNALVTAPRTDLAGYAAALAPYVNDLGDDVSSLVHAIAAASTPAPKPKAAGPSPAPSAKAAGPSPAPSPKAPAPKPTTK